MSGPTAGSRNPLLARDDVGRARLTAFDLPQGDFCYGRPDNPDYEGAREVTMQWVSHTPRPRPANNAPDFAALNKKAVRDKITNTHDTTRFRRQEESSCDGGAVPTPRALGAPTKVIPSDVIPSFTYGKKIRPSTPIHHIVNYSFAEEHEQTLEGFYSQRQDQQYSARQVRKIPLTKASRGHSLGAKSGLAQTEEVREPFKLSKFKRATAKVEIPGGKHTEMRKAQAAASAATAPPLNFEF